MVLCQHYYYWGNIMTERFRYYKSSQIIVDDMTGWTYYGNKQVCDLLNQVNRRADKNAEEYWELQRKYETLRINYEIARGKLRVFFDIMDKFHIYSTDKLEKILLYAKMW